MALTDRLSAPNRATALLLVAGGISAGLGYLWGLLAARFMAPSEYADFTAAASILYFVVIAAAPLSQSVAYFAASARGRDEVLTVASATERVVVVYGGFATLVLVALSPLLARALHFGSALPLASVFVASYFFALLSVRRGVVQGESRFALLAANTLFEAVFRLIAVLGVCIWLPRAYAGIATHALTALIAALLLPFPHKKRSSSARPILGYFASAFGATAIYAAFLNSDVVMAKMFFAPADAATYGGASFLGRATAMLVTPFYVFAVPYLVEARDDAPVLKRRFIRILAQYSALAILGIAAIALLRRQLVALLLGSDYAGAEPLLVPISIAIAIGGAAFIASQLPMAVGSFRFLPWYAAAYVAEIVVVAVWHATMLHVVYAVIAAQMVAFAVIALHVRYLPRKP